jgi:hypothetical protein
MTGDEGHRVMAHPFSPKGTGYSRNGGCGAKLSRPRHSPGFDRVLIGLCSGPSSPAGGSAAGAAGGAGDHGRGVAFGRGSGPVRAVRSNGRTGLCIRIESAPRPPPAILQDLRQQISDRMSEVPWDWAGSVFRQDPYFCVLVCAEVSIQWLFLWFCFFNCRTIHCRVYFALFAR